MKEEGLIRAKGILDYSQTLAEAAGRCRAFAEHLEVLSTEGWELAQVIYDDYGILERDVP